MLDFSEALRQLKAGIRVCRAGWNGKGMWLQLIYGTEWGVSPYTDVQVPMMPFIGMKTAENKFVPWLASQTDLIAEDWIIVDEESVV